MDKISVIIPVYKVEAYLRQCLDSVVNQTYKNLEIIIIDDGSPDGCGAICDEYAVRDERIKLVHQENKGLSAARNVGLGMATGDWIAFVDSDDWCEPYMYEKAMASAANIEVDIIMFGSYSEYPNSQVINHIYSSDFITSDREELFHLMLGALSGAYVPEGANMRSGYPWDKLYKRSLILDNHLAFASHVGGDEDMIFNLHAFYFAWKVSYADIPLYHYRFNPMSIGHKYTQNRQEIDRIIYEEMVSVGKQYSLPEVYYEAVDLYYANTIMLCGERCLFHREQPLSIFAQLKEANRMLHAEPVFSVLDRVNRKKLSKFGRLFLLSRHHNVLMLYVITKVRPLYIQMRQYISFDMKKISSIGNWGGVTVDFETVIAKYARYMLCA